jgi:flavin reductase (DIM6/NTAB) family NADH-FMN oxidoreductase RutF
MILHPQDLAPRDLYKLLIGMIVPRPIALVGSISTSGVHNLAPYSFFTGVSADPPVVCFAPSRKPDGDHRKDTLRNVETTGVFTVNIVSESFAEKMNLSSAELPPEESEFDYSGLTPQTSTQIAAPLVAESLAKMECRMKMIVPMGNKPTSGMLVIGDVLCFHIEDRIIDNYKIDADALDAVGRMGGFSYARTRDRFDIVRPK